MTEQHPLNPDYTDASEVRRAVGATCETCGGRGEIGGWDGPLHSANGYVTEPCPTCTPNRAAERLQHALASHGIRIADGVALAVAREIGE